jgi:hypothetical protein
MPLDPRQELSPEDINQFAEFVKTAYTAYKTKTPKLTPIGVRRFATYCAAQWLQSHGLRHDGMAAQGPTVEPPVDETPADTSLEA